MSTQSGGRSPQQRDFHHCGALRFAAVRLLGLSVLMLLASCGRSITYREREGCSAQRPCSDGLACTADLCRPDGTCQFVANDALCSATFCMLEPHCDAKLGCVGTPRDC